VQLVTVELLFENEKIAERGDFQARAPRRLKGEEGRKKEVW